MKCCFRKKILKFPFRKNLQPIVFGAVVRRKLILLSSADIALDYQCHKFLCVKMFFVVFFIFKIMNKEKGVFYCEKVVWKVRCLDLLLTFSQKKAIWSKICIYFYSISFLHRKFIHRHFLKLLFWCSLMVKSVLKVNNLFMTSKNEFSNSRI